MKKNDVLTLTCSGIGADMEGVCRADGMAVFVPGILPGETGKIRIVKLQSRFAFGKLEAIEGMRSPMRVKKDCPVFPRCGGCTCRHMTYAATLEAKQQQVADCFRRIGHLDIEVPPVLGMTDPYGYRNKTALPVGGEPDAPILGFYAPRSHNIIPAASCLNAMPPSAALAEAFLEWMKEYRVPSYHEETHSGLVRHLMIRVNRKHEAMVTVIVNGHELPHADDLISRLKPLDMVSLILNENLERTNVITGRVFRTLYGRDTLEDELCGLRFSLSPAAFFQVNPSQTEKLYGTAVEFAELKPEDTLCDVYCGAGTITLTMAKHVKRAIGIEVVPQAVHNAEENAQRNGISNASFYAGAAETVLPDLVRDGLRPDVIVVDPPRKGLEPEVIEAMAAAGPRRIVYVSCNVATQARDAALLVEKGYRLERVQPVDMFCYTSGVENVAMFTKSTANDQQ